MESKENESNGSKVSNGGSSSNDSIYVSPSNISPIQETKESINEKESSIPTTKYEKIVQETRCKMSLKFEELEKETGLCLDDHNDHKNKIKNQTLERDINCKSINVDQNEQSNLSKTTTIHSTNFSETEFKYLEKEVARLKSELQLKNEIIEKLFRIKSCVEAELEDLTASLFEEANKMVYESNVSRDRTEKELHETRMKNEMLTAEVQALKMLVITSTPSRPNPHLHPQISIKNSETRTTSKDNSNKSSKNSEKESQNSNSSTMKLPKKSPSNYELGETNTQDNQQQQQPLSAGANPNDLSVNQNEIGEVDPIIYDEFLEWRRSPTFEPMKSNFIKRIYDEEIYPVFNFKNRNLTDLVLRSIENNTLTVETVVKCRSESNNILPFPKKCALLDVSRVCRYRMRIENPSKVDHRQHQQKENTSQWYYISQLCRNRITTVCDLFCYLRYVQDGLVKSNTKEIFWSVMKRRKNIALSKLGFQIAVS